MKKINFLKPRAWLLLLVGLLASLSQEAFAYDFEADGIYYKITSKTDYTCEVTYGTQYGTYSGDVVVPDQVEYNEKKYTVTTIGAFAFLECTTLKSVVLPSTVTKIGIGAFGYCSLLKTVIIPDDVTIIPGNCFKGCTSLESVELGKGVETIQGYAFTNCLSLSEIRIPKTVTLLNDDFEGCSSLNTIVFEDGKAELACGVVLSSDCAVDSVYLGRVLNITSDMYTYRDFGYLENSPSLRTVYVSDMVTTIYRGLFYNCTNLETIMGMKNVQSLGTNAYRQPSSAVYYGLFEGCTALKRLVIPNNVTSLGDRLLNGCSSLETLVVGNGIESISVTNAAKLQYLYLGNSIKSIDVTTSSLQKVFAFTDNLASIGKLPTSAVVYVTNPDRYEALLKNYSVKKLLAFNETSVEYTGRTPELTYKNNVEGTEVSFDSSTTPKDAGSYNTELDVTFSMPDWQTTVQLPCSYTVTKAPLSIMTNNAQRYYGEDNPELTCEYVGFKNGETADVLDAQPTVYTTATRDSYVGTYPIYCTGAEAKNYTITTQNGTLTIIKAPQTITWEQDFTGVHVGDQIELTATASSGLSVKYRSSDQSAVLITTQNGKQYAYILKEGIAAITAYQSGDTNHEEADEITLLVNATTTGISGIHADTDAAATYYNTSGQRVSHPSGLTIIREADGTTRKVFVK